MAAINIARGATVKGDLFKVTTNDTNKTYYASAFTYGFPVSLTTDSENLRALFGGNRYIV